MNVRQMPLDGVVANDEFGANSVEHDARWYRQHRAEKRSSLTAGTSDRREQAQRISALLKAEGIASVPALINSGNRYQAPETATPALFNHVLSYLPEFDLYVDSTAGVAPFGTLLATEYGKPVAVAGDTGADLKTLPWSPPRKMKSRYRRLPSS